MPGTSDAGSSGEQGQQQNGTPPKPGEQQGQQQQQHQNGDAGQKSGDKQDGGIQKVIDAIIARERADANARIKQLEDKIAELTNQKPDAKPKQDPKPGDEAYAEAIRKPLVDELEQLRAQLRQREEADIRTAITLIAKPLCVDGADADVAAALVSRVKPGKDGKLEVVDAEGRLEYGKSGPKTIEELVTEHLKAKPYLAKASVRSGIELGGGDKSQPAPQSKEALKQQIAALEAEGKFAQAQPLKTQLARLTSQQK